MSQIFQPDDLNLQTLENYFLNSSKINGFKNAEFKNLKMGYVDCSLAIFLENKLYYGCISCRIGSINEGPESFITEKFNKLADLIKSISYILGNYTVDMEFFKVVPKKDYIEKLEFRYAIDKLLGIDYKKCYSCSTHLVIKIPCMHPICSECFIKSVNREDDTFVCKICEIKYKRCYCDEMYGNWPKMVSFN